MKSDDGWLTRKNQMTVLTLATSLFIVRDVQTCEIELTSLVSVKGVTAMFNLLTTSHQVYAAIGQRTKHS